MTEGNGKSKLVGKAFNGIVVWFSEGKGFGFVRADGYEAEDGMDLFTHFSAIVSDKKWKSLKDGQRVSFDAIEVDGKPRAVNVKAIG